MEVTADAGGVAEAVTSVRCPAVVGDVTTCGLCLPLEIAICRKANSPTVMRLATTAVGPRHRWPRRARPTPRSSDRTTKALPSGDFGEAMVGTVLERVSDPAGSAVCPSLSTSPRRMTPVKTSSREALDRTVPWSSSFTSGLDRLPISVADTR